MGKARYLIVGLGIILIVPFLWAQERGAEVILYNGKSPRTDVTSTCGAWGGGEVKKSEEHLYGLDAKESVHVRTYGFFQGVRIDISPPLDLTPFRQRGYLILRMWFPPPSGTSGTPFPGGPGGAFGSFGSPRFARGGSGGPGGPFGGPGGFGSPGMPGFGSGSRKEEKTGLEQLSVTFFLEKGAIGATRFEVDFDDTDEKGWTAARIPLAAFRSSRAASGKLKRIAIAGDAEDEFYLGQAKLVQDTDLMTSQVLVNGTPADWIMLGNRRVVQISVTEDEEVTIEADVNAGIADPEVRWNLDADSNTKPKMGLRIKETFKTVGTYDGWYQVQDARQGRDRKEPWRYPVRVVVKQAK